MSTGPAPFFLLVPLAGLTRSGYCCRTLLHWVHVCLHGCTQMFTWMLRGALPCAHRQQSFLSHGSADWKFSVQGWQVPCLVGIWFLVCNGTVSLCTPLLERGLESLQAANGIQKA